MRVASLVRFNPTRFVAATARRMPAARTCSSQIYRDLDAKGVSLPSAEDTQKLLRQHRIDVHALASETKQVLEVFPPNARHDLSIAYDVSAGFYRERCDDGCVFSPRLPIPSLKQVFVCVDELFATRPNLRASVQLLADLMAGHPRFKDARSLEFATTVRFYRNLNTYFMRPELKEKAFEIDRHQDDSIFVSFFTAYTHGLRGGNVFSLPSGEAVAKANDWQLRIIDDQRLYHSGRVELSPYPVADPQRAIVQVALVADVSESGR